MRYVYIVIYHIDGKFGVYGVYSSESEGMAALATAQEAKERWKATATYKLLREQVLS